MFKYILAVLMLGCCVFGTIRARAADDAWTGLDTTLEISYQAAALVDWSQTRWIASHAHFQNSYNQSMSANETNPILGKHPTSSEVNRYFILTGAVHSVISYILPSGWREAFQGTTTYIEVKQDKQNRSLSVGCHF